MVAVRTIPSVESRCRMRALANAPPPRLAQTTRASGQGQRPSGNPYFHDGHSAMTTAADSEQGAAEQHLEMPATSRRSGCPRHGDAERFTRHTFMRRRRFPSREHYKQPDVTERVDHESRGGAGRRHDQAADGRPQTARDIESHAVERHGCASSARGTMSPTEACHAGALNAPPHPIRKVKSSSSQGDIQPTQATQRQAERHDEHEGLRSQHDLAPVDAVGHRPRHQ